MEIAAHQYGALLNSVTFLHFWSEPLRARLAQHLKTVYFCAGDEIFRRMDKGCELYIVASGQWRVL